MEHDTEYQLDFSNTEIAFSNKSNKELKEMEFLFKLMNKGGLVKILSSLGLFAIKYNLPFAKTIAKKTIFHQFVGGENLMDCQPVIDKLYRFNTLTVLDYGAEGKSSEEDFNYTVTELIRAIEFAASNSCVPCVVTKITGLIDREVLEKVQRNDELDQGEKYKYDKLMERVHTICRRAEELGVSVFIDAEETWIQDCIDDIANQMMDEYNKEKVAVYNTFQMYRTDRLDYLKESYNTAQEKGYLLGAKIVRGAYMEKERNRAKEKNYPSPIHPDKKSTDDMFNESILFCLDRYKDISFCNASHNQFSNKYMAQMIEDKELLKSHPHINFCQLYGMSDFITFNLAQCGFNVAKYMPYGPVKEVFPYLVRRAEENSSVSGEVGRELNFIQKEMRRRGMK